ncbi:MAG: hypothetical protein ACHQU8_03915 [Gemmatimonadales bacterium]
MMPITTLLLAGLITQQPQTPPRTRPIDSTMTAVTNVAQAVADVRAEVDRFRTRAFNDPTGSVLESAAAFRTACERLTAAARAARMICRHCIGGRGQPAFDHYRVFMPSLVGLGGRCVTRLRTSVTADASPAVLRQTAIDMSNMMVAGLRPYEQRIGEIRASLPSAPPTPRRGRP